MGYPTKNIDKEIRDFLQQSNKIDLPEQQVIVREEGFPRKFPIIEVRLVRFNEEALNISQQKVIYNLQIVVVAKMVRKPRESYEKTVDLVDCIKVVLKDDLTVEGAFKDMNFGEVDFEAVTLQNESETVPFMRAFMNDIECWRVEEI